MQRDSHAWACITYSWLRVHKLQPQSQRAKRMLSGERALLHLQRVVMTFRPHQGPHVGLFSLQPCPSSTELCLLMGPVAGAIPLGMVFSRFLCEAKHVPAAKITSLYILWKQEQQRHICLVWAEPARNQCPKGASGGCRLLVSVQKPEIETSGEDWPLGG